MTPTTFPQANTAFKAPEDLHEAQVATIPACRITVEGGSLDGVPVVVTAWALSAAELELLNKGEPVYLTFIGGLPPHMVTTDFHSATHPS